MVVTILIVAKRNLAPPFISFMIFFFFANEITITQWSVIWLNYPIILLSLDKNVNKCDFGLVLWNSL